MKNRLSVLLNHGENPEGVVAETYRRALNASIISGVLQAGVIDGFVGNVDEDFPAIERGREQGFPFAGGCH